MEKDAVRTVVITFLNRYKTDWKGGKENGRKENKVCRST